LLQKKSRAKERECASSHNKIHAEKNVLLKQLGIVLFWVICFLAVMLAENVNLKGLAASDMLTSRSIHTVQTAHCNVMYRLPIMCTVLNDRSTWSTV
jgi:hypothetical protein